MRCHRTFLLYMAVGLAATAHAQGFGQQPGAGAPRVLTTIQLVGTVAGVRPGLISVNTPAGEVWGLKVPPKTKIKVTGSAEKTVLRKGLFVRFLVTVNKRYSKAVGEVRQLTIFSPSQELGRRVGVFYPGQAEAAAMAPNPAMQPAVQPGMPQQPAAEAKPKVKQPPPPKEEMFDVRAQIRDLKGNWMTVYVPNKFFKPELKVELAEDVAVELDLNTYSMVGEGDKITAIGVRVAPKGVEAIQVAVELATPLGIMGRRPKQPIAKQPGGRPPAGGDQRKPFEVADDVEREKPGPDGQPGSTEQADPAEEKEPTEQAERTKQIVAMVKPTPEEARGRGGLNLSLGGGDPEAYLPAKRQPVKPIRERFGQPENVQGINGSVTGSDGKQQNVIWQLWDYGSVKLIVDGEGTVLYFFQPQK